MTHPTNTPELDRELRKTLSSMTVHGGYYATPLDDLQLDNLVDFIKTREERLVKAAELQARANAYYEAADLVTDRPHIYQKLMKRREEMLAQLTPETKPEETKE